MAKGARKPTERQLYDRLVRAANAVIRSARVTVRTDRPWPNEYYAPSKPLWRMAEVINQLGRAAR